MAQDSHRRTVSWGLAGWWLAAGLVGAQPAGSSALDPAEPRASAVVYTAQDARDPMKSLLPKPEPPRPVDPIAAAPDSRMPEQPPTLARLEGIVWSALKRQAIIDGDVYQVGDPVGGGVIADIDRDGVTIQMPGGRFLVSGQDPSMPLDHTDKYPGGRSSVSGSGVNMTPLD